MEDSHSLPKYCSPFDNTRDHVTSAPEHVTDCGSSGGSSSGARYKLMSPAKLPISRSTCISIPPGLSPTSFLESPVLLSNIKAEPSPTTGSLFKPPYMHGSGETAALSLEKTCTNGNDVDERASSSFEFKFHTGTTSASGLSSLTVPAGLNRNGPVSQLRDQCFSQSSAPSALVAHEQPSSEECRTSAPIGIHDVPVCSTVDELNQGGLSSPGIQVSSSDLKDGMFSVTADRTSDDGYNWRKYGQKLVRGSEFPRNYYKCTYPNCEVKKIFERSPSGQITEIVYKGSHDHPKPQSARRLNPGALMSIQEEKMDKDLSFTGQDDKLKNNSMEPNVSPVLSPRQGNEEGHDGSGSQIQGINDDIDEDDPFSKRRKMEDGLDFSPVVKPIREPRVVVQTVSEVDILDDGYRWRKYGQKVVRGNPNPRSYYKCTSVGCPVRKHVERASHDPKAVITSYEGKHNHDVPTARNSNNEFAATVSHSGTAKMRTEESGSISLDLGVGISHVTEPENRTKEQIHALDAEAAPNTSTMMVVQASQIPAWYCKRWLSDTTSTSF